MTHAFDKDYWQQHWQETVGGTPGAMDGGPPNPHLVRLVGDLRPGTALDAGCGAGAEAVWLAEQGWDVTAVDISADALARAARRADASRSPRTVRWVEADLSVWQPAVQCDLVTTHYAHPSIPQLEFYRRISDWVAPGGRLLIVGHGHGHGHGHGREQAGHGHGHRPAGQSYSQPPAQASVTASDVRAEFAEADWRIVTADELARTVPGSGGEPVDLHDVVVQALRRR